VLDRRVFRDQKKSGNQRKVGEFHQEKSGNFIKNTGIFPKKLNGLITVESQLQVQVRVQGFGLATEKDVEVKMDLTVLFGTTQFVHAIRWLQMKLYYLKMLVPICTNSYAYKLQEVQF